MMDLINTPKHDILILQPSNSNPNSNPNSLQQPMFQQPTRNHSIQSLSPQYVLQHQLPNQLYQKNLTVLPSIKDLLYTNNYNNNITKTPNNTSAPASTSTSAFASTSTNTDYTTNVSPQYHITQPYGSPPNTIVTDSCNNSISSIQHPTFINNLIFEYNKLSSQLNALRNDTNIEKNQLRNVQILTNDGSHYSNTNTNHNHNHNNSNNSGSYCIQKSNCFPHSPITPSSHITQTPQQYSQLHSKNNATTLSTAQTLCSITKDSNKKIMKKRIYNKKNKNIKVITCQHCAEIQTPEWRRGPYGNRTLCNACGLYYRKLIKRFDTKNANLIMRFNKLINPMDRRIPLNVNVPNNIIDKFDNDDSLDSDYYSIKESN